MSTIDTVENAAATPGRELPFAALGLKEDEYQQILRILGRRPTSSELAMYSVMWSEHCSYKSSKIHLKQFGEKAPSSAALLVGIGENAGVVDIGQGYAATFKIESHNHPSFIEPYQGAATGIGGIVRDILAMGARPVAVMDSLRFGPIDHPDTKRVLPGAVAGIANYGNSLGLANIGGEISFDQSYLGNPLVNALCVGVMRHSDIKLAKAIGPSNLVVLYGAKTGGDGIGGVSVLASETFSQGKSAKRPAVQVGDPFMEKLLIECSLEIFAADLVVGIQDLGGAGLSCATSELASAGAGGMNIYLDRVPLRDDSLSPEEILMSESQERMCAIIKPEDREKFMEICQKWDVSATVIGEVTTGSSLKIYWHDQLVVDVPPRSVAHEGPIYQRPIKKPADFDAIAAQQISPPLPQSREELQDALITLLGSANIADKSWVTSQYDRYVRGNTILATPENSGMIRVDEESHLGIAVSCDSNARWSQLDPYKGAQLALIESAINLASCGVRPIAVSNCLNFGSPEVPQVMWQFSESVSGLADACHFLGLPVTGGNVSFYNQTKDQPILPTPVIATLGTISDVRKRIKKIIPSDGLDLLLLGKSEISFAGSAWAYLHDLHGGAVPEPDLPGAKALIEFLLQSHYLISACHDVSEGGIATSLFEMINGSGYGAAIEIEIAELFSESPARTIIATENGRELMARAQAANIAIKALGQSKQDGVTINGMEIDFQALQRANALTFPHYFGIESKNG
jgi:phosphoribosylformylglycinamidine synthase II